MPANAFVFELEEDEDEFSVLPPPQLNIK